MIIFITSHIYLDYFNFIVLVHVYLTIFLHHLAYWLEIMQNKSDVYLNLSLFLHNASHSSHSISSQALHCHCCFLCKQVHSFFFNNFIRGIYLDLHITKNWSLLLVWIKIKLWKWLKLKKHPECVTHDVMQEFGRMFPLLMLDQKQRQTSQMILYSLHFKPLNVVVIVSAAAWL